MARQTLISQQNLLQQSEALNVSPWGTNSLTTSANAIVNPVDGALTADALTETAVGGAHILTQSFTQRVGYGYTFSCYLKAGLRIWACVYGQSGSVGSYYNLSTGALGNAPGSPINRWIISMGNGWYRCGVAYTANSNTECRIYTASANGTVSFTGDNSAPAVYAWGAQLTLGTFLAPYIATTSSAINSSGALRQRFGFNSNGSRIAKSNRAVVSGRVTP